MMDSGSEGRFYIIGYGYVPRECQKKGAECDITICGRNTLDIVSPNIYDFWRFSITGDIGPLVYILENPNSDKHQIAGFSTNDVIQSFQLVASPSTPPPPVPTPAPKTPATEAPTAIPLWLEIAAEGILSELDMMVYYILSRNPIVLESTTKLALSESRKRKRWARGGREVVAYSFEGLEERFQCGVLN
jgi:hypothetical protein